MRRTTTIALGVSLEKHLALALEWDHFRPSFSAYAQTGLLEEFERPSLLDHRCAQIFRVSSSIVSNGNISSSDDVINSPTASQTGNDVIEWQYERPTTEHQSEVVDGGSGSDVMAAEVSDAADGDESLEETAAMIERRDSGVGFSLTRRLR